jgi:hypothetical protein
MASVSTIQSLLGSNTYPGRGILLGRSADGASSVIAYFIMGRSENSRNRIFTETEDGIRTEARDPSKMTDPRLIIYHPVRVRGGVEVVTNGDQTDTICKFLSEDKTFAQALRTRAFEPDEPNFTPRISGMVEENGAYRLSILKSENGDPACCCRYFYEYDNPLAGVGHLIHTYQGDGSPLPSFEGEPRRVELSAPTAQALCDELWDALDKDNRISLYVRYRSLATGEVSTVIRNKD